MSKTFNAALFDLDGTLCDTEPHYVAFWNRMGQMYRPDLENFGKLVQGIPPKISIETYLSHVSEEVWPALHEMEANLPYSWFPGALELISDLKKNGVKCAVVTSSNKFKMECVAKGLPGFDDNFDAVLTMEQFSRPKPAPDCFLLGADTLGCQPSECIVFEDSLSGLKSGMDAGIFTVALASSNSREVLEGHCDLILDSFLDISYDKLLRIKSSI